MDNLMAWARLDDDFHHHRKAIAAGLEAVGLWTFCLTWAHADHHGSPSPGVVPDAVLARFGGERAVELAERLWSVGLFDDHNGLGWPIHDYFCYLPKPGLVEARREAGRRGGLAKAQNRRSALASATDLPEQIASKSLPEPEPEPKEKELLSEAPPSDVEKIPEADRPELRALCERLADRMVANDCKRPKITKAWLTAARLLLDVDGRSVRQVQNMIDWCQADPFWRANILSMPKLREQYDQMRLRATADLPAAGKLDRTQLPESLR